MKIIDFMSTCWYMDFMRLLFTFTDTAPGARTVLPWNYLPRLVGRLHRWLGEANAQHDGISLYSLSSLNGGHAAKDGLRFDRRGGSFFISFYDDDLAKKVLSAAMADRVLFDGLNLEIDSIQIRLAPEPKGGRTTYMAASPIFLRPVHEESRENRHTLSWDDPAADEALTRALHSKLKAAGLPVAGAVSFDREYAQAPMASASRRLRSKTGESQSKDGGEKGRAKHPFSKSIEYNGIYLVGHLLPVIVEGPPEVQKFIWEVGAGHSTGIGFGALR